MTLEEDLVGWVASRFDCQKDAVARFCRNESLSAEDVATIADHLIARTSRARFLLLLQAIEGAHERRR